MSGKEGGRGLLGIEDSVYVEIENLCKYIDNSEEVALKAVAQEHVLKQSMEFYEKRERRGYHRCLSMDSSLKGRRM